MITDGKFLATYEKIRERDDTLAPPTQNWLQDNVTLMNFINQKVKFREPNHSSLFPWLLYKYLKNNTIDNDMDKYINLLKANHNLVLTGAPGTGKTYLAKKIAEAMGTEFQLVQFHPSYDYTDFVEGLRPCEDGSGFELKNGVFKDFCEKAIKDKSKKFVFIIDEINRGELSKIFGELFFAIDPGYRGLYEEGRPRGLVQTQYQNLVESDDVFHEGFYVPENVYILGTMNDIDRGVESMDFAIRRRFAWVEVTAEERASMLDGREWSEQAKASMTALNRAIECKEVGLSRAYHIGPAYYLKLDQYDGDFESLWKYHIKGLLYEYLRGGRNIDYIIDEILKPAFDEYKNVNN